MKRENFTESVLIRKGDAGHVIGRDGWRISELQDKYDVNISVDKHVGIGGCPTSAVVRVFGKNPEGVQGAVDGIAKFPGILLREDTILRCREVLRVAVNCSDLSKSSGVVLLPPEKGEDSRRFGQFPLEGLEEFPGVGDFVAVQVLDAISDDGVFPVEFIPEVVDVVMIARDKFWKLINLHNSYLDFLRKKCNVDIEDPRKMYQDEKGSRQPVKLIGIPEDVATAKSLIEEKFLRREVGDTFQGSLEFKDNPGFIKDEFEVRFGRYHFDVEFPAEKTVEDFSEGGSVEVKVLEVDNEKYFDGDRSLFGKVKIVS